MHLGKLVFVGISFLVIQACSHPIEIVGEGDVTSASGKRNCSLEQFTAADPVCSKNYVVKAYQETYYAVPRPGWQFDHWGNYCEEATPPNYDCSFDIPATQVKKFWGKTVPPITAVFCRDIPPSTPTSRFTDHGDGTVTDTQTGLMWAKCSESLSGANCGTRNGTNPDIPEIYNWQQASELANSSALANHTDWRLPTKSELLSIVEQRCDHPSINRQVFPNTDLSSYWSAEPDAGDVWAVSFDDGEAWTDLPGSLNSIRLVRDTPLDTDQDGVPDANDSCPNTPPGDMVDAQGCTVVVDTDTDGVPNVRDNCPNMSNANQADLNSDGEGDACDADDDGDGILDDSDACPRNPISPCELITSADIVTANGKEWAQPDLFMYLSWNQINAVCPAGICTDGGILNGHLMTGWAWASMGDVAALFNSYGVSPPLSLVTPGRVESSYLSPWATAFFTAGWRETGLPYIYTKAVAGFAHDLCSGCTIDGYGVRTPAIHDALTDRTSAPGTLKDRAITDNVERTSVFLDGTGAWFYKQ
jgi:hypothetical protein